MKINYRQRFVFYSPLSLKQRRIYLLLQRLSQAEGNRLASTLLYLCRRRFSDLLKKNTMLSEYFYFGATRKTLCFFQT